MTERQRSMPAAMMFIVVLTLCRLPAAVQTALADTPDRQPQLVFERLVSEHSLNLDDGREPWPVHQLLPASGSSIRQRHPEFLSVSADRHLPPHGILQPVLSDWEVELAAPPPAVSGSSLFARHSKFVQDCDDWHILPPGLMYRSYLAGEKEPRIHWTSLYDFRSERRIWETALGGRAGLLRYGSPDLVNPEGFQLDVEGAVFARVLPDEPSAMLEGADFRFGFLGTWRRHRTSLKAGYYHISAHVGDEFLIANPLFPRINYVRDSLILGAMYDLTQSMQIYGEVGNALGAQGGARPLELQFGAQYAPSESDKPQWSGFGGAPFAAVNGHLRQDFNFGGSINVVSGWGWQGPASKSRFRIGMQYYYGPSMQYSFFDRRENLLGGGLWFDF